MDVRQDIRDFGNALIVTGDLDPVYIGLYKAKLPEPQLCRLLFAYLCFYHLGASAWLSEQEGSDYWKWMHTAASNTSNDRRWPRGTERRHFRGEKCVKAIDWFQRQMSSPETPIRTLSLYPTEKLIIAKASEWPMFGPWIGFKAADLIERVYGVNVLFDPNLGLMYDSPLKALDLLVADKEFIAVDREPESLYNHLITFFSGQRAPPRYDRQCNAQEVETILCKWGSMKSGHYWVGKDIEEVREALHDWGETARRILAAMPEKVEELP